MYGRAPVVPPSHRYPLTVNIERATADRYRALLLAARAASPLVASATSSPDEIGSEGEFYVTDDGLSGFGIVDGTLVGLFSLAKGRGASLISSATAAGAQKLDCFDGYLSSLYRAHGFMETSRAANWTPGGPDVVFMSLTHSR